MARQWMFVGFTFTLLFLCSAYRGPQQQGGSSSRDNQNPCLNLISQNIRARDPSQSSSIKTQSEGGRFEVTTSSDAPELQCARVAFNREIINQNSLARPRYTNVPLVAYVVKGSGLMSVVFPGCPNTIEDPFQFGGGQQGQESENEPDTTQKIQSIQTGDLIAIPAGHVFWIYNNQNQQLEIVSVADLANHQNQLDEEYLTFLLNGNAPVLPQQQQQQSGRKGEQGAVARSVLSGFSSDRLARALGIRKCTASRLQGREQQQGQQQQQGLHVKVNLPSPSRDALDVAEEYGNGYPTETICNQKIRININRPNRPDFYQPRAGVMNVANSMKMPILEQIRMSADHVILEPNAIFAPSWVVNAHRIMYCVQGSGNVEIVAPNGERVFQGRLQRGQFLVIPQFFAAMKEASHEGFQWVAFLTHPRPYRSEISGAGSVLMAMPRTVVEFGFGLQEREVRELSRNMKRHAFGPLVSPHSLSGYEAQSCEEEERERSLPK